MKCRCLIMLCSVALSVCWSTVSAVGPASEDVLNGAMNAWRSGDFASAREQFTSIILNGTEDPRVFYFRGILAEQLGEQGDDDFRAGARLEAEASASSRVSRAIEKTQGPLRAKIEKFREDARNALKADPESARLKTIYRDAMNAREAGDLATALMRFEEITSTGTDPRYFYMHGVTLAEMGALEKAKEAFAEGLKHETTPQDVALVNLALAGVQGEVRRLIEEETVIAAGDQQITRQKNQRDVLRRASMMAEEILAGANAASIDEKKRAEEEREARRIAAANEIIAERKAREELEAKISRVPAVPVEPTEPAVAKTDTSITPGPIDMSYLPEATEYLMYVRPADMLNSGFVKPLTDMPQVQAGLTQMAAEVGFTPSDIESVTMGMSNLMTTLLPVIAQASSGAPPDPAALSQKLMGGENAITVIRTVSDVDFSTMIQSANGTEATYDGKTYHLLQNPDPQQPQMALYAIDGRTFIFASEPGVKSVISKGAGTSTNDSFGFVSRSSQMVQAFSSPLLAGMSGSIPDAPEGAPPQVGELLAAIKGNIAGGAIVLETGRDLNLNVVLNLTDSSAAEDANTALTGGLGMVKQMAPLFLGSVPPELQPSLTQAVNSLGSSSSQTVVSVKLKVPGSIVKVLNDNPQLLGPIAAAQTAAGNAEQRNNLKQIALAMHNYHDVFKHFPSSDGNGETGPAAKTGLSWRVHILPFIEHQDLYSQFHLDEPWDSDHNKTLIGQMPDVFRVPGVDTPGETSVHVFAGPDAPFEEGKQIGMRNILDGTSNTIMAVVAGPETAAPWTQPGGLPFDPANPIQAMGSLEETFNAVLCDGSVRAISSAIDPQTLSHLIQHNDGQVIGEF